MAGVVLLAGITGIALIYSAFKGIDPRSLITQIFTDNPTYTDLPATGLQDVSTEFSTGSGKASYTEKHGPYGSGEPPSGASGATPAAAKFWGALRARFGPKIDSVGNVSVRNVAGTSTPSQHSFGNALDIFSSDKQAIWAWAISVSRIYNVRLVIYNGRQWYNGKISAYTGENPHTDHVHVDFWPQYCGNPPGKPLRMGAECG